MSFCLEVLSGELQCITINSLYISIFVFLISMIAYWYWTIKEAK